MKSQFQKFDDDPMPGSGPGSSKSDQAAQGSNARRSGRNKMADTARPKLLSATTEVLPDPDLSRGYSHDVDADQHTNEALEPMKFFSIDGVAEIMNVSDRTVRRWIDPKRKQLIAHRLGGVVRIAERDLKAFIDRHRDG